MVCFDNVSYQSDVLPKTAEMFSEPQFQVTFPSPLPIIKQEYRWPFILINKIDELQIRKRVSLMKESPSTLYHRITQFYEKVLRNPGLKGTLRYEADDFFHLDNFIKKQAESIHLWE